jgi:hypothetical protein
MIAQSTPGSERHVPAKASRKKRLTDSSDCDMVMPRKKQRKGSQEHSQKDESGAALGAGAHRGAGHQEIWPEAQVSVGLTAAL